ncbi:MAG TPA: hypothetical protein VIR03_03185, partial [Candidatus Saccharimonadales bacterium]
PGADLRLLLETPTSPYFLNSRDVRSNLQQGGSCIPLYGDNRRTLTPVEEEILSEHGIDLLSPEVPQDIQRQMRTLGSLVLRHHDLATGADFIQHRDTNRYHLLEINDGPGLQTFGECWHAGEPLSDIDLEAELLIMALDSLAIERQQ